MKIRKLNYIMLPMLVIPLVFRSVGKNKRYSSNIVKSTHLLSNAAVTLIGKRYVDEGYHKKCYLYFDTDGNMTTVELVAVQEMTYPLFNTQVRRLKFGQKKKLTEWNRDLVCPTTLDGPKWMSANP